MIVSELFALWPPERSVSCSSCPLQESSVSFSSQPFSIKLFFSLLFFLFFFLSLNNLNLQQISCCFFRGSVLVVLFWQLEHVQISEFLMKMNNGFFFKLKTNDRKCLNGEIGQKRNSLVFTITNTLVILLCD